MNFVMFPREEATEVRINAYAPDGTDRYKTAVMAAEVENIFVPYLGNEVKSFRTSIARSRRGGAVEENRFSMNVEIVNADKREKSLKQLKQEWNKKLINSRGLRKLQFPKAGSGSQAEVL